MFRNLEIEMFKRSISTADLAKRVGICESSMRNKIVGRRDFKFSEILKILAVFPGLEWNNLFAQEEKGSSEDMREQESVW